MSDTNTVSDGHVLSMATTSDPTVTHHLSQSPDMGTNELEKIVNNYNRICSQLPQLNGYNAWVQDFFALMRSEWTRLRSYHARPNSQWTLEYVSAEELANAGFFFLNGDRVQCAFCRGIVSGWQRGDRPLAEHSRHYPRCPFIMEEDVGNVPIGRDPIRDAKRGHDVCGNMSAPEESVLNSIAVNSAGDIKATNMSEYGVQPHNGPKNPNYNSVDMRRRSYQNMCWDDSIPVSTDTLAEAGFYSIGMSDYVKCFYCDGGLCNWEPGDDPWIEHAKWFPDCHFVLLNKSPEFVDECRQMVTNERQTNAELNSDSDPEMGSSSGYDSDEEIVNALGVRAVAEWMGTGIVVQMMELGVGSVDVIKAVLNKRWHAERQPYTSFAQLYDAVISETRNGRNEHNCPVIANRIDNHSSDEHYSSGSDDDYHSGGEEPPLPSSQSSLSSTTSSLSNYTSSPAPEVASSDSEPTTRVEDSRLLCKICLDREIGVVFLPCGHQLACTQCAPCVADCPICRKVIRGTVRTFFS